MMHTRSFVATVAALCALFVSIWIRPDAAAAEGTRKPAAPLVEMTLSSSRIDWQPAADSERFTLTVAGSEGFWLRKEFEVGQPASLSLSDLQGEYLPDGNYTWELRAVSPPGRLPERSLVESGHFFVKDGSFVPARKKVPVAARPRPPRLLTAEDLVEDGNLVVIGNACIGESCTPADDDYSALKLKAPQPNILFDDDFVEGGSTPHDWALFINPSSAAEFSIADVGNQLIPFTIAGGAPNSSLYVAGDGKIGLGTSTPGAKLHLFNNTDVFTVALVENTSSGVNAVGTLRTQSNTAAATLQAHGSGRTLSRFGQTLASWGELLQSTGNGLIIGTLSDKPLILGTNSSNRFHITGSGNIGIGTTSPVHPFQMASGAHVTAGGVWTNASSRELKHDIRSLEAEEARSTLARLEPVRFRYNADTGDESLGFIAEDVPDLVATADHKTLSPMDLVAVLTRVVQEQQKAIGDLQATVTSLSGKLAALEEGKENGAESR